VGADPGNFPEKSDVQRERKGLSASGMVLQGCWEREGGCSGVQVVNCMRILQLKNKVGIIVGNGG